MEDTDACVGAADGGDAEATLNGPMFFAISDTDAAVTGAHGIPVGYAALAGAYLVR